MQKVIESRAAEMTLADGTEEAAGGSTGLLVRTEKVIGTGDRATTPLVPLLPMPCGPAGGVNNF
jgi:hypothetical protein